MKKRCVFRRRMFVRTYLIELWIIDSSVRGYVLKMIEIWLLIFWHPPGINDKSFSFFFHSCPSCNLKLLLSLASGARRCWMEIQTKMKWMEIHTKNETKPKDRFWWHRRTLVAEEACVRLAANRALQKGTTSQARSITLYLPKGTFHNFKASKFVEIGVFVLFKTVNRWILRLWNCKMFSWVPP